MENYKIYFNEIELTEPICWEFNLFGNKNNNEGKGLIIGLNISSNMLDVFEAKDNSIIKIIVNGKLISFKIKDIVFCGIRPINDRMAQVLNVLVDKI